MRDNFTHTFKDLNPVEGCVAFYSHRILSTNLTRGSSITYLFSLLIISSKIKEVLSVVWSVINKSVQ